MTNGDGAYTAKGSAKINCYSGGEGAFMEWGQAIRGKVLEPVLGLMAQSGMRANHVTLCALIAGLAFCPLFLWGSKPVAFLFLLLHVLLDGFDGPLARYRGQASNRGSFTDTMSDQLVVTATALTLIHAGHADAWPGGLYVFFYAVVVAFAFVRNALDKPYSWLFRPRFPVFAWFAVEVWWWPGSLNGLLWLASAILALKCLTGFVTIRKRM